MVKIEKTDRVVKVIEAYFRENDTDWDRMNVRFSDVAQDCLRKIWYEFNEPDKAKVKNVNFIIRCALGNMAHDIIQHRLIVIGALKDVEISFTDKKNGSRGKTDGRCRLNFLDSSRDSKDCSIFEFKTVNYFQFKEMLDTGLPLKKYVDQAMRYMIQSGDKEADIVALSFDGYLQGWVIYFDEDYAKELLKKERKIARLKGSPKIPDRPFLRDSIPCSYCRFIDWCWRDIPREATPPLETDQALQPPSEELLKSAVTNFKKAKIKISEYEELFSQAETILWQYFKSTGTKEIEDIQRIKKFTTKINLERLLKEIKFQKLLPYISMSINAEKLKEAVKVGVIDGGLAEKAKDKNFSEAIEIKKSANGKEPKE